MIILALEPILSLAWGPKLIGCRLYDMEWVPTTDIAQILLTA